MLVNHFLENQPWPALVKPETSWLGEAGPRTSNNMNPSPIPPLFLPPPFPPLCFYYASLNPPTGTLHKVGKRKMPYWVLSVHDRRRKGRAVSRRSPLISLKRTPCGPNQVMSTLGPMAVSGWGGMVFWMESLTDPPESPGTNGEAMKNRQKSESHSLFPATTQLHLPPLSTPCPALQWPSLMPFPKYPWPCHYPMMHPLWGPTSSMPLPWSPTRTSSQSFPWKIFLTPHPYQPSYHHQTGFLRKWTELWGHNWGPNRSGLCGSAPLAAPTSGCATGLASEQPAMCCVVLAESPEV